MRRALLAALLLTTAVACGTAASAALAPDAGSSTDAASEPEAGCSATGLVPHCPCTEPVPGTVTHIGALACADGTGPEAVACGQEAKDGGARFDAVDGSVWVPFFACPDKQKCSAVTTSDELTCSDESTGAIVYYAILGAPCFHEDEGACSLDRGTLLACEGGSWTAFSTCASHSCAEIGAAGNGRPACGAS